MYLSDLGMDLVTLAKQFLGTDGSRRTFGCTKRDLWAPGDGASCSKTYFGIQTFNLFHRFTISTPEVFVWQLHSLLMRHLGSLWFLEVVSQRHTLSSSFFFFNSLSHAVSIVYITTGTLASIPHSVKYFYVVSSLLWFVSNSQEYPLSGPSFEALAAFQQKWSETRGQVRTQTCARHPRNSSHDQWRQFSPRTPSHRVKAHQRETGWSSRLSLALHIPQSET